MIDKATADITIAGISNYSQCRMLSKEQSSVIDKSEDKDLGEHWKERLHINKDGFVIVPQMAIMKCLIGGAGYLGESVPGQGKKKYKGFFMSGIMCPHPFVTNVRADDKTKCTWELLSLDGQPGKTSGGGGTRVPKRMPYLVEGWEAKGQLWILDPDVITEKVLKRVLYESAGIFVGIGRFRPEKGGYYGRFMLKSFSWKRG